MRASKPITVTLGELQKRVEERVQTGAYRSASDVLRAGLRALDREEAARAAVVRQRVQEALDNPAVPQNTHDLWSFLLAAFTIWVVYRHDKGGVWDTRFRGA